MNINGEAIVFIFFVVLLSLLEIKGFSHPVLWFLAGLAFIGTGFNRDRSTK